jgi:hypothetical protein
MTIEEERREYNYPAVGRFSVDEMIRTVATIGQDWRMEKAWTGDPDQFRQVVKVVDSLEIFCYLAMKGKDESELPLTYEYRDISTQQAWNLAHFLLTEGTPEGKLAIIQGADRAFNAFMNGTNPEQEDINHAKQLMAEIAHKMPKVYENSIRLSAIQPRNQ